MAGRDRDEVTRAIDRRIALARDWDELVDQVRRLGPLFVDFQRPPRLQSLLPGVGDSAAVVVNVTDRRCDALLVTAAGVRALPLRDLTADDAGELAYQHLSCLRELDRAAGAVHLARERTVAHPGAASFQAYRAAQVRLLEAQRLLDDSLTQALDRLRDAVTAPVLAALGPHDGLRRLWWCPTGPLMFLPLHAADLDGVVASYTPTLRALVQARSAAGPAGGDGRMLAVSVADPPGEVPLPQAERELELLRDIFPPEQLTVLRGTDATRAAVVAALPAHEWAFFSCHGRQDLLRPSTGGLLLSDGPLSVMELARGRYRGEFGFLSACHTATGGVDLTDEVITLASAIHHAGFAHVVASLWSADAVVAAQVAEDVLTALTRTGRFESRLAALAVHRAVVRLRDADPDRPSRWALFTHTGP
jgi:hypothetical protein